MSIKTANMLALIGMAKAMEDPVDFSYPTLSVPARETRTPEDVAERISEAEIKRQRKNAKRAGVFHDRHD